MVRGHVCCYHSSDIKYMSNEYFYKCYKHFRYSDPNYNDGNMGELDKKWIKRARSIGSFS